MESHKESRLKTGKYKPSVHTRSHSEDTDSSFILSSFLCVCSTRCRPDYWPVGGDTLCWHPPSVCSPTSPPNPVCLRLCLTLFICLSLCCMHHMTSLPRDHTGMPASMSICWFFLFFFNHAWSPWQQSKSGSGRGKKRQWGRSEEINHDRMKTI